MARQRSQLSSSALREPEIKAALIDTLFDHHKICSDTVLVNEMPVPGLGRRADLVLANGHLIAFEIKSHADSTRRLDGQLKAYSSRFEGTVVIAAKKHVQDILDKANDAVGVCGIFEDEAGHVHAKILRRPRLTSLSIRDAIAQMRASDLYRLARSQGLVPANVKDRYRLEKAIEVLDGKIVRLAALRAIKERYRPQFSQFVELRRSGAKTRDSIDLLKKEPWANPTPTALGWQEEAAEENSDNKITVNSGSFVIKVKPRILP